MLSQEDNELLTRTDAVVAERGRVSAALRDAGYRLPPSQANFVWLPLDEHTLDFVAQAANNRINVRPYGQDGVRVTIGEENSIDAMRECTLITSTYMYRDQVLGILGVVGPRRLP